jgi:hypothetical protein
MREQVFRGYFVDALGSHSDTACQPEELCEWTCYGFCPFGKGGRAEGDVCGFSSHTLQVRATFLHPLHFYITSSRQIPYAIGQFTVNEFCHELAFGFMSEETKRNLSASKKFSISLSSGIIAGFAAAILSQVRLKRFLLYLLFAFYFHCGGTELKSFRIAR